MCAILIIINLFKTNALEDEHLLSPDKIYLCQKIDGLTIHLREVPTPHLL